MKIAVYTIALNEEKFVERWYTANKDADYLVIADTGSTDKTVEKARELGILVHEIRVKPWRFDDARNAAMALIPADADVCVSVDMDEVLYPGWREALESQWGDANHGRFLYTWNHLEDGSNGLTFWYEKIHARHGYRWKHPVHEILQPDRIDEKWADIHGFELHHFADPTKSRGQYMPLLELAVAEDPRCPRNAFYHARELTFYYRWQDAIVALDKYLDMPEANWQNERCYAMRLLAKSHDELGHSEEALKWARLAVAEAPGTREPWVELSMQCYRRSMWAESYAAALSALNIQNKELVYTMDPSVWTEKPYDLASIAAWNLGLKDSAVEFCKKALEFNPTDSRLVANLASMIPTTELT